MGIFSTFFHLYPAYLHEFQFSELLLCSTDQHNQHTEVHPNFSVLRYQMYISL